MSDFMEYDPITGIKTEFKWNENDQEYTLLRTSDVQSVLDYTRASAADSELSKRGMAESWFMYAKLPPIVILQMRAKGIDVFNRDHQKRMFEEINTHYPHLKCTVAKEGGKVKGTFI